MGFFTTVFPPPSVPPPATSTFSWLVNQLQFFPILAYARNASTLLSGHGPLFYTLATLATPTIIYLLSYFIPAIHMALRPVPNLKKRYNATWALVTGGGSGIGKALCFKLASQGLNVVVCSIDDSDLKDTTKELRASYPELEFREVGISFSPGVDYMSKIKSTTKDITVQCVFNNAGFIVTGFFEQAPLGKHMANLECNAVATVPITHHFVSLMAKDNLKGCVVFTSSVAGFIPTPFAAMYASTKAFVSQFACCVHIEVKSLGIDVCAVHPSPVASNFYDKVDHKIELMEAAQKSAVPPQQVRLAKPRYRSLDTDSYATNR